MLLFRKSAVAAVAFAALSASVYAEKSTVCTITVNSPNEKQVFQRYLPEDQFQFVELIERGRPDWLRVGMSQAGPVRRAGDLRPFRRRHRVLFRQVRCA
jgi:hypothetical protein